MKSTNKIKSEHSRLNFAPRTRRFRGVLTVFATMMLLLTAAAVSPGTAEASAGDETMIQRSNPNDVVVGADHSVNDVISTGDDNTEDLDCYVENHPAPCWFVRWLCDLPDWHCEYVPDVAELDPTLGQAAEGTRADPKPTERVLTRSTAVKKG